MATEPTPMEDQDQAEILDEDNVIGAGDDRRPAEMRTFENIPDVRDETSALGDADDDAALIAEQLDDDELVALARDEQDGLTATEDHPRRRATEVADGAVGGVDEAPLLDAGSLDEAPDSDRADPARYEARRLSDRDIDTLGYGEDDLG